MKLSGHVALVTGGRRGIGAAIARRLAAEGAAVVVGSLAEDDEGLTETLEAIRQSGGRAAPLAFDLADGEARADAIARASAVFGPIDIVVNNAAANNNVGPSEMDSAYRRILFEVNVHAPVDLIQQALPHMKAQGWGRIVNITSGAMRPPKPPFDIQQPKTAIYGASKLALERITTGLATELHGTGVTANSFHPTAVAYTGNHTEVGLAALRRSPQAVESVEMMAEAAFLLIANGLTGLALASRDILFMLQASLHALDGKTMIGDANSIAEIGA
jgi:NAD(P)-dependent dehydrogenase (short-subunit alcohol dehydrogenase family)